MSLTLQDNSSLHAPDLARPASALLGGNFQLEHLKMLEAESIFILREAVAEFAHPVMLYSIGKDSSVMLRLAQKAFHPGKIPFPLLHIDTSDKFHEITKYYSITRHAYPPGLWMMALAKYNALPDDLKKVIDESMQTACAQHRQDEVKQEAEAFTLMKAKGVQINEVKDIREFQERAVPVWKFLEGKVGKEFFDRVVAEAKATAR